VPARGPKVLIVDDEVNIRQSLRGVLEDENYDCTAVESGEACLELLPRESFEAVLLDIWLPGVDGLETLSRIQELPAGTRPAVIMISGHGNIETAVRATKLGAFDFVEKPLTIEKVSARTWSCKDCGKTPNGRRSSAIAFP
jgi:two-component system, NtrC family, nitrogen regulation response regulator NtrX